MTRQLYRVKAKKDMVTRTWKSGSEERRALFCFFALRARIQRVSGTCQNVNVKFHRFKSKQTTTAASFNSKMSIALLLPLSLLVHVCSVVMEEQTVRIRNLCWLLSYL
jgi:hypothetical protein